MSPKHRERCCGVVREFPTIGTVKIVVVNLVHVLLSVEGVNYNRLYGKHTPQKRLL